MGGRVLFFSVLLFLLARIAVAQPSDFSGTSLQPPSLGETGTLSSVQQTEPAPVTNVQAYINGLMSGLINAGEFPGIAVAVIQNGEVTFKAGYGYADVRGRIPVDADRTRFRVASISKLVTATAVMQVAEQGKVDLNADVNTYLSGFKIPPTYPEPVTLANILTHTAGFDDRYVGIGAPLGIQQEPLGTYLARSMPPRVMPPNKTFSYSNHAIALAGHIVESVSGQEFGLYVQENIFAPIGMTSSGFGVPYPLPSDIAVPYAMKGSEGGFTRRELDRVRLGPAGDLITTAGDIAKFMILHLNNGTYGDDEHMISLASAEKMHQRHFTQVEGLDGWAYGFAEGTRNNVHWIGHDGSWGGYCAQLVLQPETKSGFFVVYNADCHFSASAALRNAMFDLLWPAKTEIGQVADAGLQKKAEDIVGTYMAVRRARADFTQIAAAATQFYVAAPGDGVLVASMPDAGRTLRFLPQGNGIWINPDYQMKAAAVTDSKGRVTQFAIDSRVFDRVSGVGEWAVWTTALILVIIFSLMAIWGWTNGFLSRQLFGEPQAVIGFAPRLVAFLAASLTVVSLITMTVLLGDPFPTAILDGPSVMLIVLLSVPIIVGLLVIPMIIWSVSGFGSGPRARLAQAGYAVLTLAILTYIAFAWQWGLNPFAVMQG